MKTKRRLLLTLSASIFTMTGFSTAAQADGYVFGLESDGTLYHYKGDQTADWAYLCVDGDCRSAELNGDRWERNTDITSGTHDIQFKVQDDTISQCIADANVEVGAGVTSSECTDYVVTDPDTDTASATDPDTDTVSATDTDTGVVVGPETQVVYIVHKATGNKASSCGSIGDKVAMAGPDSTSDCAKWEVVDAKGKYFYLRGVVSDGYIRPRGLSNGIPIMVQPTSWTGNYMQWSTQDTGDGYFHLVNRQTKKFAYTDGSMFLQESKNWTGDWTRWQFVDAGTVGGDPTGTVTDTDTETPTDTDTATDTGSDTGTVTVTDTDTSTGTDPLEPTDTKGRNIPAEDKVLFILGQDTTTLRAFKNEVLDNPSLDSFPAPGGVTLYSSILGTDLRVNNAPSDADLYVTGIEGPPYDNSNGEVSFDETLTEYDAAAGKKVALAVGLYLSDEWADCGNQPLRAIIGTDDEDVGSVDDPTSLAYQYRYAIDRMINWFKEEGRPVYLRIGYEFDGPWNCYSQEFYKQAFRYIKDRIEELGATNVATVWQSATYPDNGDPEFFYNVAENPRAHYEGWYPGDDYVDWVGISFFAGSEYETYQWSCPDYSKPWTVADLSPRELQDVLADFARDHGKPVIIAESAPQGWELDELGYSCISQHQSGKYFDSADQLWDAFFSDYFKWITDNKDVVRAFSYINTDWQTQDRWFCEDGSEACEAGFWGDTRLEGDLNILDKFETEVKKSMYTYDVVMGDSENPITPDDPDTGTGTGTGIGTDPVDDPAMLQPGTGQTMMFIGQDLESVSNYIKNGDFPAPTGVTTYVAFYELLNGNGGAPYGALGWDGEANTGKDLDWGGGPLNAHSSAIGFTDSTLQIGLNIANGSYATESVWCAGCLAQLANGGFQDNITRLADFFKEIAPKPVYLRIGYEFDGNWNMGYEVTDDFIKGYQAIVDGLRDRGVDNVAYVWQSCASPIDDIIEQEKEDISDWYPGDDYVDWVGLSWFMLPQEVAPVGDNISTQVELADELLDFAEAKGKPVMIAESTPQGYHIGDGYNANVSKIWDGDAGKNRVNMTGQEIWDAWFVPFFTYIESNQDIIKAVSYINANWDSQGSWGDPYTEGFWGDGRVEADETISELWNKELSKPYWIHGGYRMFQTLAR